MRCTWHFPVISSFAVRQTEYELKIHISVWIPVFHLNRHLWCEKIGSSVFYSTMSSDDGSFSSTLLKLYFAYTVIHFLTVKFRCGYISSTLNISFDLQNFKVVILSRYCIYDTHLNFVHWLVKIYANKKFLRLLSLSKKRAELRASDKFWGLLHAIRFCWEVFTYLLSK